MEMQYFVKPGTDVEWFNTWKERRWKYFEKLGVKMDYLRWHQHGKDELAHYAKDAYDIEYLFPMGWKELEGVHNRGAGGMSACETTTCPATCSTPARVRRARDLQYIDQDDNNARYTPCIIETSAGLTREVLMLLCDAYDDGKVD